MPRKTSLWPAVQAAHLVVAAVLGLVAILALLFQPSGGDTTTFLVLLVLGAGTAFKKIRPAGAKQPISLSFVLILMAVAERLPLCALLIAAAGSLYEFWLRRSNKEWRRLVVDLSSAALSVLAHLSRENFS